LSESDPAGPADEALFPGFRRERIRTREAEIHTVVGGHGPPVLLLHGYPETHACWHRVAPALASRFTVVCPDLRGYGDSSRPLSDPAHRAYSIWRDWARDVRGQPVASGHFLPEEAPAETLAALEPFLAQ
jgi:haloacetate dehalogenase